MLAFVIKSIHLLVCIVLIVIVLFQADKGEGLAGAFGGGASATIFGERGAETQISKMTTWLAVVFMCTSLVLAVWGPGWDKEARDAELKVQMNYNTMPTILEQQAQPLQDVNNPVQMPQLPANNVVNTEGYVQTTAPTESTTSSVANDQVHEVQPQKAVEDSAPVSTPSSVTVIEKTVPQTDTLPPSNPAPSVPPTPNVNIPGVNE